MKMIDTTLKGINDNNAQTKSKIVLIEHENRLFRISCNSNTYNFQSGGDVAVMGNDNKWETLKTFNMFEDYGIEHSYEYFNEAKFDGAITDLKKFIKKTAKYLVPIKVA